ncbi:hypothetical protein MKO06_09265 [Gramella sp. GC03-9]|uniref:Uncharacterized protein n=1 Tax=Christiangramia oceanisediminis TaxID=2920386 RepID=A0A9X2I312_9FLAO|nr:hypothetical protein [Gramella oceanisediminis]MCP9200096.1 hypothetical protein [Gramella oceanisediminis]
MKTNNSKYQDKSGFRVPEDYFESFDARMMDRLKENSSFELPDTARPFKVPAGYFDDLESRILDKSRQQPKGRVINLFRSEYLYYAAAVAAIFILMLGNFYKVETTEELGWDDIEISVMENYIDEGYEMGYIDLNTFDHSEFISEDGTLIDDSDFENVSTQDALDYLDENLEDPTYILE